MNEVFVNKTVHYHSDYDPIRIYHYELDSTDQDEITNFLLSLKLELDGHFAFKRIVHSSEIHSSDFYVAWELYNQADNRTYIVYTEITPSNNDVMYATKTALPASTYIDFYLTVEDDAAEKREAIDPSFIEFDIAVKLGRVEAAPATLLKFIDKTILDALFIDDNDLDQSGMIIRRSDNYFFHTIIRTRDVVPAFEEAVDVVLKKNNYGGITPTGEIDITTNGQYDVTDVATANVDVQPPFDTFYSAENGRFDIAQYNTVDINVPASAVVSGTQYITANGLYNVTNYANASVNVPEPVDEQWKHNCRLNIINQVYTYNSTDDEWVPAAVAVRYINHRGYVNTTIPKNDNLEIEIPTSS